MKKKNELKKTKLYAIVFLCLTMFIFMLVMTNIAL